MEANIFYDRSITKPLQFAVVWSEPAVFLLAAVSHNDHRDADFIPAINQSEEYRQTLTKCESRTVWVQLVETK